MRRVYQPTADGPGSGFAFYFFFGIYDDEENHADREAIEFEQGAVIDDIQALCAHGYRAVLDTGATREKLLAALYNRDQDLQGSSTVGLLWSSHGDEAGQIQTIDGSWIGPEAIESSGVSPAFRLIIFSACAVGQAEAVWRRKLRGAQVFGWGKPITFDKAKDFYTPDDRTRSELDDILERVLCLTEGSIAERNRALEMGPPKPASELAALFGETATLLETTITETKDGDHQLEYEFADDRTQQVTLWIDTCHDVAFFRGQMLYVDADIGPLTRVIDSAALLRRGEDLLFSRIFVSEEDGDQMRIQGGIPLHLVTPQLLAAIIFEVAAEADSVEEELFGTDED